MSSYFRKRFFDMVDGGLGDLGGHVIQFGIAINCLFSLTFIDSVL